MDLFQLFKYVLSGFNGDEIFLDFYVQTPEHHFNPWFKGSQRLHRDLILGSICNLISFIKKQIDFEYYVWTHVDENYIPNTPSYHTRRFAHAVLIYGYDDSTRTAFEQCDIYDVYLNYTHLLKINPDYHNDKIYEFSLSYFTECMGNYFTSFNEIENFKSFYAPKLYSDRTFGLNIYNKLTTFFELMSSKQRNIERRLLYTLREHKKFMNLKIKYIEQEGHYRFPTYLKITILKSNKKQRLCLTNF